MATEPIGENNGAGASRALGLQAAGEASLRRWGLGDPVISPDYLQLIGLEQEASTISIWHLGVVPGLLQTEDYARHVIDSYGDMVEAMPPGRADDLIKIRMARQEILDRPHPADITVVLDEAVLQRPTGGKEVMLGQLSRLAELALRPNIAIRVLPHDGPHPVLAAPFNIFRSGATDDRVTGVVTSEKLTGITLMADADELRLHERLFGEIAARSLDVANSAAFIRATQALRWH